MFIGRDMNSILFVLILRAQFINHHLAPSRRCLTLFLCSNKHSVSRNCIAHVLGKEKRAFVAGSRLFMRKEKKRKKKKKASRRPLCTFLSFSSKRRRPSFSLSYFFTPIIHADPTAGEACLTTTSVAAAAAVKASHCCYCCSSLVSANLGLRGGFLLRPPPPPPPGKAAFF